MGGWTGVLVCQTYSAASVGSESLEEEGKEGGALDHSSLALNMEG